MKIILNLSMLCLLVLLIILSGGCRSKRIPIKTPEGNLGISQLELNGYASWYGDPFHGRRTSNGEVYDMNRMTAAHKTLPFNTVVKVNNLDNGKSVQVRINDRGPFIEGRIIDLSYKAALMINMVRPGTARVRLDILRMERDLSRYAIQIGSFKQKRLAGRLKQKLLKEYSPVDIRPRDLVQGKFYQVLVGNYKTRKEAARALRDLRAQGYSGFITRRD